MKKRLNDIQSMLGVDVVIENQIGPIAKRMKDVQVLLTRVFYNEKLDKGPALIYT
jgi:hypothetical protein